MFEEIFNNKVDINFKEGSIASMIEEIVFDGILFFGVFPEIDFGRYSQQLKIDIAQIENEFNGGARKHLDYITLIGRLLKENYRLLIPPDWPEGLAYHDFIRPDIFGFNRAYSDPEKVYIHEK